MNLNEYQQLALRTAGMGDKRDGLFLLMLGLNGEVGEVSEKVKKIVRDHAGDFSKLDLDNFSKELGDVLWYLAVIADYFDIPFEEIGKKNIEKLASRLERGKLSGSGDNR
jgi:NTP pyrophosphatase (non-canonical NTP hydrolase)